MRMQRKGSAVFLCAYSKWENNRTEDISACRRWRRKEWTFALCSIITVTGIKPQGKKALAEKKMKALPLTPTHKATVRVCVKYSSVSQNNRCYQSHQAKRFTGNSDSPFSSHFGDVEAKVHRVEIGRLPLEDFITPPGLVSLQVKANPPPTKISNKDNKDLYEYILNLLSWD